MPTYRTTYSTNTQYTSLRSPKGAFIKTEQMMRHNEGPNKFQRTEIIQSMLFNHSGIKVEITSKN